MALRSQEGIQSTGLVSQSLNWDTRNRAVAATEGHHESLGLNVAGLGGSNKFVEITASTKSYFSLGESFVFSPTFSASFIEGFGGEDIPIYKRYSMGGIGSLRGFDSYGVTLRDPATGDIIGGDKMVRASLDLFFPIPYMKTEGFRGVIFLDAGTLWGSIDTTVGAESISYREDFSASKIRSSAGVGFEWISPVGPLGLVWGFPINKVEGDIVKSFEFAIGASF